MLLFLFFIVKSISSTSFLNTTSGIYVGRTVHYRYLTVEQYLGIEYGRIQRRFDRAEVIRRKNNSILNATSFGPVCKPTISLCTTDSPVVTSCFLTYGIFSVKSSANEQCLFLNLFIPTNNKKKKAILIWIHGGSGQTGTGNHFDGTILAALGNLIVVTFNFRLNLFGFLSSGDQRLEGNFGLYDQAMVLDWVFDNIDALGGDKHRITLGGHSAGAPHAYYLAQSSFNRGRIRHLILQSGCPFHVWSHIKAHQAMERFNTVANDNQCGMLSTFEEKLQCLRDKDYHSLVEHEHQAYTSANHTNVVLHRDWNETEVDLEILMGANDDEGIHVAVIPILIEQYPDETLTLHNVNFTNIALKFLGALQPDKSCLHEQALKLYHIHPMPINCSHFSACYCSHFYNYSRLISDILFYNEYYHFLLQHPNQIYLYQYSYRTSQEYSSPCHHYFHQHHLVGHFAELEYTWGTPLLFERGKFPNNLTALIEYIKTNTVEYTNEQIEFSREMIEHWSNFINHGRPSSKKVPHQWLSISNGYLMNFKLHQNELKKFEIPSTVQFWRNTCLPIDNLALIDVISLTLFFCTSIFLLCEFL